MLPGMRRLAPPMVCLVVCLVALAGALAGCSSDDDPGGTTSPPASATPLSAYDTSSLVVPRADICGLLPTAAAERALGAPVATTATHVNGDRVPVGDGEDVMHEFGCSWSAADGTTATAWVFAPPVTVAEAGDLAHRLPRARGCRAVSGPELGTDSVITACHRAEKTELAFHGLFGDAWLSCAVTGRGMPRELRARASVWCVDVLEAVGVAR